MIFYEVVLKSLEPKDGKIVLSSNGTMKGAEESKKLWRKALGEKHWTINRRPGVDTLEHLVLTIEKADRDD